MKLELEQVDIQAIAQAMGPEVIKALKPLLDCNGEPDTILDVKGLAEYLKVSPQWVYERVQHKEIPYSKIGKFPRFKKSHIDKWLDSKGIPAINPLSKRLRVID